MNIIHHTATAIFTLSVPALLSACSPGVAPSPAAEEEENWSVTAWGEIYEVFPEVDALRAGEVSTAHTHVTVLAGFTPLIDGEVEIVLRSAAGEETFSADTASRPGIFNIEIRPAAAGDYEIVFRVSSAAGSEEIAGGQVSVGTDESPGSLIRAARLGGDAAGGETLSFLKEQQWRGDFATAWVSAGTLPQSVEGVARVRPPAGGETAISAPVDGVLLAQPWPYPGRPVGRGEALFSLVPRVAQERSLATLEAERSALEGELSVGRARLERLRRLYELEATSRREIDEAEARVDRLAGSLAAAERDLEAAYSAREGGSAAATVLAAPFGGEISAVLGSPGGVVEAGDALANLVRTDAVWLEVAVSPQGSRQLSAGVSGVTVDFPEGSLLELEEDVRLVSVAPQVDSKTGTVAVFLQVPPSDALVLGTVVSAQILLRTTLEGVVVPTAALIDDGGVTIVYVQISGEEFARVPVRVGARQGERAIIEGLTAAQRLVTRGGESIRRSSLLATGEVQGHVH